MKKPASWWQQVTGEAIQGRSKVNAFVPVVHDEVDVRFVETGKTEWTRVAAQTRSVAQRDYASADWEQKMVRVPVASKNNDKTLPQRTLVVGVTAGGATKAYPIETSLKQSPIIDEIAGIPIVVVLGSDGEICSCFRECG